ncbi:MAG: prepilin-type N-terminal cleavage/methylation domain-containing protein [Erysipelotrichaceae bacterium]
MRVRSGFTLIELLIAINLSMLLINIILMSLSVLPRIDAQIGIRQNQNGIIQLRQKLALCRITKVVQTKLSCTFNQGEYLFSFEKNRLVSTPGYVVYLEDIKSGRFTMTKQVLSLDYTVGRKEVHAVLAYVD